VLKVDPVPVAGLPPGADQLRVIGGVPPDAVAEHATAVPTVPVDGHVMETVRVPPTWAVVVNLAPLVSVTFSLTVKGPAVE
jgi:hypothetical protein